MKMNQSINIYPKREYTYQRELELLKTWKITPRNRKLIQGFSNFLFAQGSKHLRVAKLSSQLRRICLWLSKDLDLATQQDLEQVIGKINQFQTYSEASKADYRRCIKQFYKWYRKQDPRLEMEDKVILKEANKLYDFLKDDVSISYKKKIARFDNIITDQDIKKVLSDGFEGVDYPQRDRAFLALLHETGARIGEILTMTIGCIQKQDKYARITIEGKTGVRNPLIVSSVPYLFKWVEVHPYRNNDHSPLWVGQSRRYGNKPITHRGAYEIVHNSFNRAGIRKKHNLHWFRHSRATILSQHLKEVPLCKYMGWVIGSKQTRTYCHASDQQTDDGILALHGLQPVEQKTPDNTPKECPICAELNQGINEFCGKCGSALSLKTALNHEQKVKSATDELMQMFLEMAKDPKKLEEYQKFKEKWDKS